MPGDPVEPIVLTSDISQIMLPNGTTYTFKDATARSSITALSGAYVYKGSVSTKTDLPSSGVESGWVYLVTDEGVKYDWNGTEWEVFGGGGNVDVGNCRVWYGTCATSAATQAKTVTITGLTELKTGDVFIITFTYSHTYNGTPTLNINSLGAHDIHRLTATNAARYEWCTGETLTMVYDGTYFEISDAALATTTYYGATKLYTGATSTSGSLASTPASLNSLALDMISGAPVYSTSSTYAVGDRVRYQYKTWECTTAIPTKESWNAAHWKALDPLQEQIDNISGDAEQYAYEAQQSALAAEQWATQSSGYADDASAAQTAAEAAQTAAENAQTAAETAESNSSDWATAAANAQTAAEAAQSAAETAQGLAETAASNADTYQSAASQHASDASDYATAASGSATAAAQSAAEAASYINSLTFATIAEIDALFNNQISTAEGASF